MQKTAYDPAWANAEKLAVVALAAKEVIADKKPAGIDPALIVRCRRLKAQLKGVDAPKSADDLVIRDLETKKLQEKCIDTTVAKHRAKQKKTAAKAGDTPK